MSFFLILCQLIPLLAVISIFVTKDSETKIAKLSFWFTHAMGVSIVGLLSLWGLSGFPQYEYHWFTLFDHHGYTFPILFYLDKVSAVYLFCVWSIFSIIVKYCRVYLHREIGYKRFFQAIFGFVFGLNIIVLAGNIDLLFAGWEIVGISSFLLIAFYRSRPQPVRNALRAYTIYRFCDVGLLLGAWLSHLLFHGEAGFYRLPEAFHEIQQAGENPFTIFFLAWLLILAASGKSAQFPFSFWLPRAMEGPTPSSAIFYGALSIHLGVFLLLRTQPIWMFSWLTRGIIFSIGLLTVIVASLSEKTQSNIKGQIAYASITQVGFMFIELSFGLETLVLVHCMGNAFLRCYQLLMSPSIVAHLLRVEGSANGDFHVKHIQEMRFMPDVIRGFMPEVVRSSLYVFSLQEGLLERLVKQIMWIPLQKAGHRINQWSFHKKAFSALLLLIMLYASAVFEGALKTMTLLPVSIAMVMASLSAFTEKRSPLYVWNGVALSSVLAGVSVWLMNTAVMDDMLIFMSGIIPSWLIGLMALKVLLKDQNFKRNPFAFRAMAEFRPRVSLVLFISFLGLVGFPISPAFIGEDLLLSHASEYHIWFSLPLTIAFIINGISAARVFLRLCMGRPTKMIV